MNSRQRILNLFSHQPTDHLAVMPITMQLASDLAGVKYSQYATDYKWLVEGQLRVIEEFDFDHVGCISDPAREAADCGASVIFAQDSPPALDETNSLLADKSKLVGLNIPDPLGGGRMHDRVKAAELFKTRVGDDKIIEGWVEGPCAEGADLRGINRIMMDFFEDPSFVNDLFAFCTDMGLEFAEAQVQAGADIIGVGDAAASLVGPVIYEQFVWPFEKKLINGIQEMGAAVRLHICGDIRSILEKIAELNCEFVDIDYLVPMAEARQKTGPEQIIGGNVNPVAVLQDTTPREIYEDLAGCYQMAGDRFVVSAGCEITRTTPRENIAVLTEFARSHALARNT